MELVDNNEFDQLVNKVMEVWKVPALSIAIVHKDNVWSKAYGFAKLSPDIPATTQNIFDCASTSKSFTAAAVALLVQDDDKFPDVKWDTPVSKLLPDDFVLPDPMYTEHVTIEDILSHRTGMPRHDDSYLGQSAKNPDTPKSMTRNLRNLPLSKPLRTTYQYNNMMYTAASYLVETLTKTPYAEFLKEKFWDPLGMTNTYHDYSGVQDAGAEENLATGYSWHVKKEKFIPKKWVNEPEGTGAGSIISCPADYIKWVRSFLQKTGPLSKESQDELVKGRTIIDWDPESQVPLYGHSTYALGWLSESYRGHRIVGHGGSVAGFDSLMRFLPEHEWGIYVIGNSNGADEAGEIIFHWLTDRVLGVKEEDRIDWFKWWKDRKDKAEAEDDEDDMQEWEKELRKQEKKVLGVPIEQIAGHYYDPGYKDLIVEWKDGKLEADCSDRCFGFLIEFEHVSEDVFVALIRDTEDLNVSRVRAEIKIEDGGVKSLGVDFEGRLEKRLIWFQRVD